MSSSPLTTSQLASVLQRKHSGRVGRSPSVVPAQDREQALQEDIRHLERKLKELPYVDLRVEVQNVEEFVSKIVADLVVNTEEHHEIQGVLRQVEKELKEIEDRSKVIRKSPVSSRRREGSPALAAEEATLEHKRNTKLAMLKKFMQLKAKNDEQKSLFVRCLTNLCRQGKRGELEERLRLRKAELQLERINREKAQLESKLKEALTGKKANDENDPNQANHKLERTQSGLLKDKDQRQTETSGGDMLRNGSLLSSRLKDQQKCDLDDGKNSDLSRKGSFRTNVSRRYQERDDDDDDADNDGDKESQRSSSRVSYSGLSQTYSQKKVENVNDKRNTHDIKSLERLVQPGSTKSTKGRDTSNDPKKKYFSNTGEQLTQYSRKYHKSDIFVDHGQRLDHSGDKEANSKVLYKNHFVLP